MGRISPHKISSFVRIAPFVLADVSKITSTSAGRNAMYGADWTSQLVQRPPPDILHELAVVIQQLECV